MAYKGNKLQLCGWVGGWVGGAHLRNVFWERLNAEHGLVQCCSLDFTTKKMETFYGIFHANSCFSMCSFTLVKLYQEFRIWYNFDTLGHAHRFHYIRSVHKSSFWEISNMPVWVPLSIREENSNSCSPSKIDHAYQIFCQTPRHFEIIFWTEPLEYWLNFLFFHIFENDIGGTLSCHAFKMTQIYKQYFH